MIKHPLSFAAGLLLPCAVLLTGCSQPSAPATSAAVPPVAAAGAQTPTTGQARGLATTETTKLFADYQSQCAGKKPRSRDCEILRSLVVAEIATGLQFMELARDQRGTAEALLALEFPDEPDIFVAGCRILGQFPTTPGIAAKVLPQVLENRYIEVQRVTATLIAALPDAAVADVGRLWIRNHGGLRAETAYDEYPEFPSHYAAIGFPKYPGAEWFSPADSDRSIGWSTKDDAAAVTKWFSQALKADAMDMQQWLLQQAAQASQAFDQSKMTRWQQLMERAMKGDQAAVAELEKLQKENDKASADERALTEQGLDHIAPPDSVMAQARWIVAKKKSGRVSTIVLVYPLPGIQRTVIQLAWHLADYLSAWPNAGN